MTLSCFISLRLAFCLFSEFVVNLFEITVLLLFLPHFVKVIVVYFVAEQLSVFVVDDCSIFCVVVELRWPDRTNMSNFENSEGEYLPSYVVRVQTFEFF